MNTNYNLKSGIDDSISTIQSGTLKELSQNFFEAKSFFQGSPSYEKPYIVFEFGKEYKKLELKETAKGYTGSLFSNGYKYGCNLNRVRNQRSRWGLTVWIEEKKKEVA